MAVTAMLSHARTGLLVAIAAQDLPQIVEYKAKAAAIQEVTKQLRLGKEMQLDAAEFLRRAERGLGVAIREGQKPENGTVETVLEAKSRAGLVRHGTQHNLDENLLKPKPTDLATPAELYGNGRDSFGIYDLTDNVSEVQFEEALAEAKAEQNLPRANVARKAKAKIVDPEPRPEPQRPKDKLHCCNGSRGQRLPHGAAQYVLPVSGRMRRASTRVS